MDSHEYVKQHPEQFKDNVDKWLFYEFGIIGGCCASQKALEYSVARRVAVKLKRELTDVFVSWVEDNNKEGGCLFDGWEDDLKETIDFYV